MNRPKLLDLFCCAGGAAMGYYRAGFDVVGVDIKPQPHYPFEFIQADALTFPLDGFDAYHASPPCQHDSVMTKRWGVERVESHPDLIAPIRKLLIKTGLPYVIENVEGAKEKLVNPIYLCGTMFGLRTKQGSQLRRHRYFETSFEMPLLITPCCHNKKYSIRVYGGSEDKRQKALIAKTFPATIGVWGHAGGTSNRDGLIQFSTQDRKDAMGIDWMTGDELSGSIPPAYTEFIGKYLMKAVTANIG